MKCGNLRTIMPHDPMANLSRRERQIMEIVYAKRRVSAADVQKLLGKGAPGYSAVRSALALLEKKGLVAHAREGLKYIFEPIIPRDDARKSVLQGVIKTFFQSSVSAAVQALLSDHELKLSEDELREIESLIKSKKSKKK